MLEGKLEDRRKGAWKVIKTWVFSLTTTTGKIYMIRKTGRSKDYMRYDLYRQKRGKKKKIRRGTLEKKEILRRRAGRGGKNLKRVIK